VADAIQIVLDGSVGEAAVLLEGGAILEHEEG
jgi:hypothetical protein